MKIQRVTFLGVRGVGDLALDFTNPRTGAPHDVVILAGPPASGKTRALEAIVAAKEAIGPYGPMAAGGPWIAAGSMASKVVIALYLDEEERTYAGTTSPILEGEATFLPQRTAREAGEELTAVLERYEHGEKTGKVEYFPASRRVSTFGPFHGMGALEQRLLRPGKDPRKYSFIMRFLREIEGEAEVAQRFSERLAALSPTCRFERTSSSNALPRGFRSREGSLLSLGELSDSESDAVLFAATAVALDLHRSLVLIDRPELYADARWLRNFMVGLRSLGEDNQLILASSSPELAAAAEDALVVSLEG
jgi:hypothetical protein